jgi:hypothetical protein
MGTAEDESVCISYGRYSSNEYYDKGRTISLSAEYRYYYTGKSGVCQGTYYGPYLRYFNYYEPKEDKWSQTCIGGGGVLGYQLVNKWGVAFNAYTGAELVAYEDKLYKSTDYAPRPITVNFRLGLCVGLATYNVRQKPKE